MAMLDKLEQTIAADCFAPKATPGALGQLRGDRRLGWGCRCGLRNVCPRTVQHVMQFEVLRLRLSRFVDDRKAKGEYISGSIALAIVGEAEGTKWHTDVVLGHAVFSPKVQTFVRCGACDTLADDVGFATAEPPPRPWDLRECSLARVG